MLKQGKMDKFWYLYQFSPYGGKASTMAYTSRKRKIAKTNLGESLVT